MAADAAILQLSLYTTVRALTQYWKNGYLSLPNQIMANSKDRAIRHRRFSDYPLAGEG